MIFRQLQEPVSSTYCYLLACPHTHEGVLIDPVLEDVARYRELLHELGLRLLYTLETHVHADHVTAADALRATLGSRTAVRAGSGADCADLPLNHGDVITVGTIRIEVRATPGHTDSCVSYVVDDRVFTGDALLIGGCGRTDFQQGDPCRLYDSVCSQLFTLPPDTLVFPAHDYRGRTVSTIREEKATNARLGGGKTCEEFKEIMNNLNLAYPKQIDRALPANLRCGKAP
ncbi:MAG: MBL fold metallo-hydrolase [Myxococcales bacterium]|nr:MBL fold metallo-hydrolase [Myxococcales bacterium]